LFKSPDDSDAGLVEVSVVVVQDEGGVTHQHVGVARRLVDADRSQPAVALVHDVRADPTHASRADLPATEVFEIGDTVIVRPDPVPVTG
jgi:hypothetical protein